MQSAQHPRGFVQPVRCSFDLGAFKTYAFSYPARYLRGTVIMLASTLHTGVRLLMSSETLSLRDVLLAILRSFALERRSKLSLSLSLCNFAVGLYKLHCAKAEARRLPLPHEATLEFSLALTILRLEDNVERSEESFGAPEGLRLENFTAALARWTLTRY